LEEATWDEALGFIATRLKEIRKANGADSLAFMSSPRCSNEEAYLLEKLARGVIGTNNVDHGTGAYCNNSIDVLLDMIGVPATTNSIAEIAKSEVVVVDGVDLARRMPTLGGVVIRAKLAGARLIVIGTRRHRVAESADLFLQIKPGTEPVLYGAMAKIIQDRGLMDHSFIKACCKDYDAFLAQVREYDLLQAADACGVSPELIEAAALIYAEAESASVLYSSSMEARTKDTLRAIVNLVLLTGNLGKQGSGIFALSEQNNLQGVCDMGMLPDRLPGYQLVSDAASREGIEKLWKVKLSAAPGLTAKSIFTDRGKGKLKALWLSRYDPVNSTFFMDVPAALRQLDLVVVQHLFLNDSTPFAHVVLPTTAFGEERVSFTSTDRRIQLAEQVIDPPVGLKPAWEQLTKLAGLLGAKWNYKSAADVMEEIGEAVPFYGGASYDNLARDYGRQWPCTKDRPLGTRYLFASDAGERKFRFIPIARPSKAPANPKELPLTLIFGNSLYYWNQNVLIRHSETLKREYRILFLDYPDGFVEINSEDAKKLKIRDGEKIRLCAEKASAVAAARLTPEVLAGTILVPHFMRDVEKQILGADGDRRRMVPVRLEKEPA
jgi:predicted molibdopterin-dependent oxidoreductase YjgC